MRLKTAIKRDVKGGKVIGETFAGKLKDGVTAKRWIVSEYTHKDYHNYNLVFYTWFGG